MRNLPREARPTQADAACVKHRAYSAAANRGHETGWQLCLFDCLQRRPRHRHLYLRPAAAARRVTWWRRPVSPIMHLVRGGHRSPTRKRGRLRTFRTTVACPRGRVFINQNGVMTLVSTPRPSSSRSGAVLAIRNSAPRRQAPRWRLWLVFRLLANKHASTGASPVVSVQLLNLSVRLL
jgi:hypothetical protein